jgi:hypothetical protein
MNNNILLINLSNEELKNKLHENNITHISNNNQFNNELNNIKKYNLIISNYNLNYVKKIRQYDLDIPIVIVSNRPIGDKQVVELLTNGANNYLLLEDIDTSLNNIITKEITIYNSKIKQSKLITNLHTILLKVLFSLELNICNDYLEEILDEFYNVSCIDKILLFKINGSCELECCYPRGLYNIDNIRFDKNNINLNDNNYIGSSNIYDKNSNNSILYYPIYDSEKHFCGLVVYDSGKSARKWSSLENQSIKLLSIIITIFKNRVNILKKSQEDFNSIKDRFNAIITEQNEKLKELASIKIKN